MKNNKAILAAAAAAAVCILCTVSVSANENEVDEQQNNAVQETDTFSGIYDTLSLTARDTAAAEAVTNESDGVVTADPGWEEDSDGKIYYVNENGEKLTGYREIDGKEYFFSAKGVLKSGFYTVNNVRMFFSPETYERLLGWVNYNDVWFYLDEDGKAVGRKTIDGKEYIFDEHGACYNGWFEYEESKYYSDHDNGLYKNDCIINEEKYYFSSKGRFISGWITSEGIRVFYDYDTALPVYGWINYNGNIYYSEKENGKCTGDITIDGIKFRFADTGCQQLGFQNFPDGTRYYDETTGEPVSGLMTANGNTYCFSTDTYLMQTGFVTISSKTYYFDNSGVMQTGFVTISGKKYYFDKNGVMQTGFVTISGKKYYFDNNGVMQTGFVTISGKKYYFDDSGVMQTGFVTISGKKYYFDNGGVMQTGFVTLNGNTYYFDKNGVMQTGFKTIDGKEYYFDENGIMDNGRWSTVDGSKYYYGSDGNMYKSGVFKIKDDYYCFSDTGAMQTGWQKIGGSYYLFDRIDGKRQADKTVDGITVNKDGTAKINDWSKSKIETMMTAHRIMLENTNPSDTMETKRLKCFNWIMSFPYHRFRMLEPIYKQQGWEMEFANDIFTYRRGCCVSEAAALAFLFREIGYTDVAICHDSSHAWTTIGQYLYDPLFAESKSFEQNYNVIPSDYRVGYLDKRVIG